MKTFTLSRTAAIATLALLAVSPAGRLLAQTAKPDRSFNERWQKIPGSQQRKQTPTAKPKLAVDLGQALYLIRSTLLTLNDANRSGNYSVLRDLASPALQNKNSAADLAVIFSDLRNRHFDLFAAALMAPKMTAAPQLDAKGILHMAGFFPTRPLQINFDLMFQNIGGKWLLFGLAVGTPPAAPLAGAPAAMARTAAGR